MNILIMFRCCLIKFQSYTYGQKYCEVSEHAHTQKKTKKREDLQSVNFACPDSAFQKERKIERNRVR